MVGLDPVAVQVVSRRQPTPAEWRALRFAWKVAKHVKSNAIVLTSEDQVLGVGAGQMSRVDAARLAVMRAREHGHKLGGAVVRLGRVLSVPGRARRRGGGGRHRRHPSGGLDPGRGDRGGGRRARHGHGHHRDPALQALTAPGWVFTERDVVRLLALNPRRTDQLRRLGLLHPAGRADQYAFRDLVALRVARTLLDQGVDRPPDPPGARHAPAARAAVGGAARRAAGHRPRRRDLHRARRAAPRAVGPDRHGVLREGARRGGARLRAARARAAPRSARAAARRSAGSSSRRSSTATRPSGPRRWTRTSG